MVGIPEGGEYEEVAADDRPSRCLAQAWHPDPRFADTPKNVNRITLYRLRDSDLRG
jgi:hypothetical protein